MSDKLVNGRVDIVTEEDASSPTIKVQLEIGNKKVAVEVKKHLFTKYDPVHKIILAKRLQFLLKLAYAVIIHKSQGMTLDAVVIVCSYAGTPGQIGVAVVRVKTTNGVMVKYLRPSLIKTHPKSVYKLYEQSYKVEIKGNFTCCNICRE